MRTVCALLLLLDPVLSTLLAQPGAFLARSGKAFKSPGEKLAKRRRIFLELPDADLVTFCRMRTVIRKPL